MLYVSNVPVDLLSRDRSGERAGGGGGVMGEGEMPGQGSPVSVPSPGAVRRYIGQLDEAVDSVLVPVVRTLREGATAVYSQASVGGLPFPALKLRGPG